MLLPQHECTSAMKISIHANHIIFHFFAFRKPPLRITTQAIARFSKVDFMESKPLFCFYISFLFACLM